MRVYSREFRMEVVRRILNGEKVSALSLELGIHRKLLYEWTRRVNAGGASNLRQRGRPRRNEKIAPVDSPPQQTSRLGRDAPQQPVIEFLRMALQRTRKRVPGCKREWADAIFETIEKMAGSGISVEMMCELSHIGRSGYYRYLQRTAGKRI